MTVPEHGEHVPVARQRLEELCAGHFPGDPIVPGASIAGLLAEIGAEALARRGLPHALAEVERCTFFAPLRPADDVVLVAALPEPLAGGVLLTAEVRAGGRCVARGRFRFT